MSGGRTLSLLLVVALTACAGGLQEDAGDAVATSTPPPPPWLAETDAGTGVGGPPAPRSEALEPALAPDAQAADAPLPDAEAPTSPAPAPESEAPAPATEAPAPATEAPAPATEAPAPATEAPAPATEAPAAAAESGDALPADIVVPDAGDATPPADATPDVLPDVSPDANPPPAPTDACAAEPTRCDICTCRLCGERWAMCFADAGCAAIMECSQRTGCFGDACVGPCGLEIALAGRLAVARAIEVAECSVVRCGRTLDTCAAADPGPPAR